MTTLLPKDNSKGEQRKKDHQNKKVWMNEYKFVSQKNMEESDRVELMNDP